jgi:CRP-like cAMP-binding protein
MASAEQLADHPLFRTDDLRATARLLARTAVFVRQFSAKQIVLVQGETHDRLTVIAEGRLTATIDSPGGQSLLVETLSAPDIIAPAMLFSADPVVPVTLTAQTDGRLISLEKEAFTTIARAFPVVYERLLSTVSEKFAFIATKMRLLHFATLREKIAGYVLERLQEERRPAVESPGTSTFIELPYNRDRLAELFGVARPSLSRALGAMVDDGLLVVAGKRINVIDRSGLELIASGE